MAAECLTAYLRGAPIERADWEPTEAQVGALLFAEAVLALISRAGE